MKEVSISSIGDLSRAVENIQRSDLCRGVSDSNYELKPSLFRCDTDKNYSDLEQSLMWIFKTHAKAHLDRIPKNNYQKTT